MRLQKNILDEIVHFAGRNAREQYAVNHARITIVETAVSAAIAAARGFHQDRVVRYWRGFRGRANRS